jgi:hypothetical protein
MPMPEPVRYRSEIQDAGMPMPVALTSMPMPNYGKKASSSSLHCVLYLLAVGHVVRKDDRVQAGVVAARCAQHQTLAGACLKH